MTSVSISGNILELAKRGDGAAIANLINRSIQSKGILAAANLNCECLHIDLQSPHRINQKAVVALIRKGMLSLKVQNVKDIAITAYLTANLVNEAENIGADSEKQQIWQIYLNLESGEEKLPPEPEIISEIKPEVESETSEIAPEAKSEVKSEIEPEIQSEVLEISPKINPALESEPKSELQSEPNLEIAPEIKNAEITEKISDKISGKIATALVHQPVEIKHVPQAYQDIIMRFVDPHYGHIKCLCTLTELVQAINNFGNLDNPASKNLQDAIAESTTIDENGDRLINNISVLQPGSQWQNAKIRLVINIFFEAEGYVPPTAPEVDATIPRAEIITLDADKLDAIETPASRMSEEKSSDVLTDVLADVLADAPKTPKQILLEDLSSLLGDIGSNVAATKDSEDSSGDS